MTSRAQSNPRTSCKAQYRPLGLRSSAWQKLSRSPFSKFLFSHRQGLLCIPLRNEVLELYSKHKNDCFKALRKTYIVLVDQSDSDNHANLGSVCADEGLKIQSELDDIHRCFV